MAFMVLSVPLIRPRIVLQGFVSSTRMVFPYCCMCVSVLPKQVWPLLANLYPLLQLQLNEPGVLVHTWSQGLASHSFLSMRRTRNNNIECRCFRANAFTLAHISNRTKISWITSAGEGALGVDAYLFTVVSILLALVDIWIGVYTDDNGERIAYDRVLVRWLPLCLYTYA